MESSATSPATIKQQPATAQPPVSFRGRPPFRGRGHFRGFTIIELLVAVSIIVLLVAILLPALGQARKSAWAVNSLANTRSWGIGTHSFLNDYKHILPWEGEKQSPTLNFPRQEWWGNSVPPYVGQPRYADLYLQRISAGLPVPQPPDRNIFIDPSAKIGPEQLNGWPLANIPYYFSYVPNADLVESVSADRLVVIDGKQRLPFDNIRVPSNTVLMFELRAGIHEVQFLPDDIVEKNETDMLRMKGDEKHFAGRHFEGGHLTYADGHARHANWMSTYEAGDWLIDGPGGSSND